MDPALAVVAPHLEAHLPRRREHAWPKALLGLAGEKLEETLVLDRALQGVGVRGRGRGRGKGRARGRGRGRGRGRARARARARAGAMARVRVS